MIYIGEFFLHIISSSSPSASLTDCGKGFGKAMDSVELDYTSIVGMMKSLGLNSISELESVFLVGSQVRKVS